MSQMLHTCCMCVCFYHLPVPVAMITKVLVKARTGNESGLLPGVTSQNNTLYAGTS